MPRSPRSRCSNKSSTIPKPRCRRWSLPPSTTRDPRSKTSGCRPARKRRGPGRARCRCQRCPSRSCCPPECSLRTGEGVWWQRGGENVSKDTNPLYDTGSGTGRQSEINFMTTPLKHCTEFVTKLEAHGKVFGLVLGRMEAEHVSNAVPECRHTVRGGNPE